MPQDTSYVDVGYVDQPVVSSERMMRSRSSYGSATKDIYSGTVRVQDNQFGSVSYGTTSDRLEEQYVDDGYKKSTSRTQDAYETVSETYQDNSYTEDYHNSQESYVPPTTQIYQDTNYQTNTYPKVSETNVGHYENSHLGINQQHDYQTNLGYNENTVDYNQEPYKQLDAYQVPYKQDPYQQANYSEPYKQNDYQETYKQDNYSETYKQDSYQESFDDSYKQDSSLNESYKQDSFPDSYKHETTTTTTYDENYKQDTYENTYKQDSFGESYKQDSYADSYKSQDIYQESGYNETCKEESYQEPYKQENGQYNGYGGNVETSVYDNNVATSVAYEKTTLASTTAYEQQQQYSQNQYDNKYIVTSTGYEESYENTNVPVSQDNYSEPYRNDTQQPTGQQQDINYRDSYRVPYSKESQQGNYEDGYRDYPDRYPDDAYQESYDEQQYKTTTTVQTNVERRRSQVPELSVTTPRGQTRTNGYQSSESEYFYPSQESEHDQTVSAIGSSRRKKLASKRDASPLLQQNTDSLESRDDELKDSFETAVSSVGSSQPRKAFSEYSTAGESSPLPGTMVDSPISTSQVTPSTLPNHVTSNDRVTITAIVHGGTATLNGKRPLERTDSYAEDVIDDEEAYPDMVPKQLHRKDSQLSHQSQLSQHSNHSQKPKLIRGDSYASDHYNSEDGYPPVGRRDSFVQLARNDSYASINQDGSFKASLSRGDSYKKRGSTYGQTFTTPQPISRAESCQRGYFKDQDSIDETDIVLSSAINGDYKMRKETLER